MVDETNSRKEGQPNVPANAELTKSIEKDGELKELERPSFKLRQEFLEILPLRFAALQIVSFVDFREIGCKPLLLCFSCHGR